MPRLPKVSGADLVKALERKGYVQVRTKGSHVRLYPPGGTSYKKVTVPLHKEIKPGTLSGIMRDTGLILADMQ